MMNSEETTTITIRKSTKSRLKSIKGKKDWNSLLEELYLEKRGREGKDSLSKLRALLDDEDLNRIIATSKKFRKGLRFT